MVNDLLRYWSQYPPVNELLSAFMGYTGGGNKASDKPSSKHTQSSDAFNVTVNDPLSLEIAIQNLAMFGGGTIQRNKKKK